MSEHPTFLAVVAALAVTTASAEGQTADRHVFTRPLMGTEFRIVIAAVPEDSATAHAAADRAFDRVAALERILSDYDPASELSRLSESAGTGRWVAVSDDLFTVLERAVAWSDRSGGAFDVTVGSLTKLWRRASRRGSVPDDDRLAAARAAVGHERLQLDSASRSVRLAPPGMRLDAGGIGKGYAADAALAVLAGAGFPAALVDAGGDILAGRPPPGETGWRVALSDEVGDGCALLLADAALATSGARYRGVDAADGTRHSHILDPRTGRAVTHGRTVTVLAPTATEADALSSALSVLDPAAGRALAASRPGVSAWATAADIPQASCPIRP